MAMAGESQRLLTREEVLTVQAAFDTGLARAARSLSEMVGSHVNVMEGRVEVMPLAHATALAGTPDAPTVAIYLGITGGLDVHVVLLFSPADADRLVELLLGQGGPPPDDPSLVESALGEVGNVMGSSFATVLGDLIGSPLWSTLPRVQTDMARALVDGLVIGASGDDDHILVAVTRLARLDVEPELSVRGTLLVIPEPAGLLSLVQAIRRSP